MADFDPYYRWLGIPAEEQPAHHYRLLGLTLFESDRAVIESRSLDQIDRVRKLQLVEDPEVVGSVLGALSLARSCLLDADQKAAYDAELFAQLSPPPLPVSESVEEDPFDFVPVNETDLFDLTSADAPAEKAPTAPAAQSVPSGQPRSTRPAYLTESLAVESSVTSYTGHRSSEVSHRLNRKRIRKQWRTSVISLIGFAVVVALVAWYTTRPAYVVLNWTNPDWPGAVLLIDGKPYGKLSPSKRPLRISLKPGGHQIVLRHREHGSFSQTISLSRNARIEIDVRWRLRPPMLQPNPGK